MPTCPKCHKVCKTEQGLAGHLRFRHQTTIPKQDLPIYARDRIEKSEAENARLREQLNRNQRQRQDLETFYEKQVMEQNALIKEMQLKAVGQQVESSKQQAERSRLQQTLEEQRADLHKQVADLQKQVEGTELQRAQLKELTDIQNQRSSELEKRLDQVEKQEPKQSGVEELRNELEHLKSQMAQNSNHRRGLPPPPRFPPPPHLPPPPRLPTLPDPLRPFSSFRELRGRLFRHD